MLNKITYRIPLNAAQGQQFFSNKKEGSSKTLQKVLAIGVPTVLVIGAAIAYYYSKNSPSNTATITGQADSFSLSGQDAVNPMSVPGAETFDEVPAQQLQAAVNPMSVPGAETFDEVPAQQLQAAVKPMSVPGAETFDEVPAQQLQAAVKPPVYPIDGNKVSSYVFNAFNSNQEVCDRPSPKAAPLVPVSVQPNTPPSNDKAGTLQVSDEALQRVSRMIFDQPPAPIIPENKERPALTKNEIVDKSAGGILIGVLLSIPVLLAKMRVWRR